MAMTNPLRILLIADWHLGLTSEGSIRKQLGLMQDIHKENPVDCVVNSGDYCGGQCGWRSVKTISKWTRDYFPDTPILSTLGNHDKWLEGRKRRSDGINYSEDRLRTAAMFHDSLDRVREAFKAQSVHFLDEDGPWRKDHYCILGHTLWYQSPSPPTNDGGWLPLEIDGKPTMEWLTAAWNADLQKSLDKLGKTDVVRIFASHFPIIETNNPVDAAFAGPYSLYRVLKDHYGFGTFLNGHTHRLVAEPGHWCVGSDYYNPRFLLVEI
jgi:predicted phosphodiesterase